MHDLPLFLTLFCLALLYVSVLLFIDLRAKGVPRKRIRLVIVELWVAFLLIAAIFAMVGNLFGLAPSGGIAQEFVARMAHWNEMPLMQRVLAISGVVIAVVLFLYLLRAVRAARAPVKDNEGAE